jgi:hypothetical protein
MYTREDGTIYLGYQLVKGAHLDMGEGTTASGVWSEAGVNQIAINVAWLIEWLVPALWRRMSLLGLGSGKNGLSVVEDNQGQMIPNISYSGWVLIGVVNLT